MSQPSVSIVPLHLLIQPATDCVVPDAVFTIEKEWTSVGQGFILQRSTIIGGGWEIELLYIRKYLLLLLFKEIKNIFSVSISTIINVERHDPQKLFIVLKNF